MARSVLDKCSAWRGIALANIEAAAAAAIMPAILWRKYRSGNPAARVSLGGSLAKNEESACWRAQPCRWWLYRIGAAIEIIGCAAGNQR
jgi:hypothetical protein